MKVLCIDDFMMRNNIPEPIKGSPVTVLHIHGKKEEVIESPSHII
jgi:hypothetical protein